MTIIISSLLLRAIGTNHQPSQWQRCVHLRTPGGSTGRRGAAGK